MILSASPAHALDFTGGDGDGYAVDLMYSRSWGFIGGGGKGDTYFTSGNQTLMTITSAANQTFTIGGDTTVANSAITITQNSAIGAGVLSGGQLRIIIPSNLAMTWDTSKTTVTSANGKVNAAVSYINSNKTLVLIAASNFNDGDTDTLTGLAFNNFTNAGLGNLMLDITSGTGAYEWDSLDKLIMLIERTSGFLGGGGKGDVDLSIYQHPLNTIDFGVFF